MSMSKIKLFRLAVVLSVVLSLVPLPAVEFAGLNLGAGDAQAVPFVVAIKRDTLVVDNDANNQANPGDTIRYAVIITNTGTTDASNVLFGDTIDANTTLVPGTVKTTPIARNDGVYAVMGNVGISVPAGSGLLANDDDPDGGALTVFSFDATSSAGGEVTVNADGSFGYNPPPGYEGTDIFEYFVIDDESNIDAALVALNVSDVIWFVDAGATCPCDGRLSNPFPDLAATADSFDLNAADDPGDNIYLAGGAYSGGLILLADQRLVGAGSSSDLAAVTGVTVPPFSAALPAFSGIDPTITSSGHGIIVTTNNTVRGLTVGNTGGTGLTGLNVGTLTVNEVTIAGTGGGLDINGGTLAVSLDGLSASSSTDEGLRLVNVGGSFSVPGGSLSTSNVPAIDIDGNPSLSLAVTLDDVSASGAANGILVRDTTGNLAVTGSGSTDATGGTISNITGRGASFINSSNVSLGNMAFNNAPTADGPTCTSLDNSGCNAAIHLENTSGVVLNNVDISGSAQEGINGLNVTDFTLAGSSATQCGDAVNEGCLRMVNLAGTAVISATDLSFAAERVAQIENSGVTLALTVVGSTFRDTQSSGLGADGLEVTSDGASNTTIDVVNSSFLRNRTNGLQVFSEGTSFVSADVTGSTFDRGTGIGIGLDLAAAGTATLYFNVVNNPLINSRGSNAVNVFADGSATVQGRINNNTIQAGGATSSGFGIRAQANTDANVTLEIDGNAISNIGFDAGIEVISRLGGTGRLDATINNNTVTVDATNSLYDIWVQAQDSNTTCANVTNNAVSGVAIAAFRARTVDAASTVILEGTGATAADVWSNNGNTPGTGPVSSSHNGTLSLGGTCNTVTHPTAAAGPSRYLTGVATGQVTARAPVSTAGLSEAAAGTGALWGSLRDAAAGLVANLGAPAAHASGETVNVTLGDLNPGQVVLIVLDVTVDAGFPPSVTQVCNQGLFSGDNFINLLTDDPAVGGVTDPTCRPVVNPNTAPLADDDAYSTDEDTALNVAAPGVLDGDTDAENDPLTAALDSGPANGSLTLNGDGSFSYTPDADYCGPDGFTYHANDGLADSNVATVTIDVLCVNDAPLADDDAYSTNEDTALNVAAPGVLDGDTDTENDALTAVLDGGPGNGALVLNSDGSFSYTPDADYCGPDGFAYHANDGLADSNTATVTIDVVCINDAPAVAADQASVAADEGQTATNNGMVSDADGDAVTLTSSIGTVTNHNDGTWSWSFDTSDGPAESQTVTIVADDGNGGGSQTSFALTVNNVAPSLGAVSGPPAPVPVNQSISFTASFTDPAGTLDAPYLCTLDYGDGSGPQAGAVSGYTCSGSHSYTEAGVYTVLVAVTDKDGGSGEAAFQFAVVFDPDGGFVTGGGWIDSPAGAYVPDPSLTGRATFGFVSKYKRGASTPSGSTEFQFETAGLSFHSDSYDWLVVAGAKGMFKGTGTIDGAGHYGFLLSAVDAGLTPSTDADLFRIKIWDMDNGDAVVYDNQVACGDTSDGADPCTALGGGSIVIHTGKK